MIEESAKSRPLAKFGRVNAATKGKNADNLILISLLEMAAWKKGGVVMKDLPDPTRRWSRRSVAEWADMLKLHFDSAKRALRNLANHNLIEKHVFTHQNGAKVLLVRPTQRALGIWGGQGDKFEGDNEPPVDEAVGVNLTPISGISQPYDGGPADPVTGDKSPFSIEESLPFLKPTFTESSCDPYSGIANGVSQIQILPEGEDVEIQKLEQEKDMKINKGLDSVSSLKEMPPVKIESWEAEKTPHGFAECFIKLRLIKQGGYVPSASIATPGAVVGALKPVFNLVPPGHRLDFLRWAVDNWNTWASSLKNKGMIGKATFEGVTGPQGGKSVASPKGSKNYDYSHLFLAAHRSQAMALFITHKKYEGMYAPKPKPAKSPMVDAPKLQSPASEPAPPKPKKVGLNAFDALFNDEYTAKD